MPKQPARTTWMLAILAALTVTVPARAERISVSITGIDQALQEAVRGSLSASRYAGRDDVSDTQARLLADDAAKEAQVALRPYGYYNARASSKLEHAAGTWRLRLQVTPGTRIRVAQLDLQLPGPAAQLPPVRKAVRGFHPRVGEAMQDSVYEASKGAIGSALVENGYLDAKATEHRVEVTRAEDRADIRLHYSPGERYKLGAVDFEGSQFAPGFLQRYVPWQSGDWYTQSDLLALQQALTDADYFSIVDVEPQPAQAKGRVVPVKVEVAPAKRRVYSAGVFVGTDTGPGVRGGVRWRWLNRRGHKLDTEVIVAQRLKTAQAVYEIPQPGPNHRSFNLGIGYRDENTKTSLAHTFSLAANDTRDWHGFVRTIGLHLVGGTFTV
ncbi:MAG TPA: POTRA domain-containing protein, partial [Rhodanobacteraceae bacterium]|nr:POTRA domain-containing protein [Rhodanobacteraceae bacterium]